MPALVPKQKKSVQTEGTNFLNTFPLNFFSQGLQYNIEVPVLVTKEMKEQETSVEYNIAYGSCYDTVSAANTVNHRATNINVDSAEAIYEEIDQIQPPEQMGNSKTARNEASFSSKILQRVCYVTIVFVLFLALLISLMTVVLLSQEKSNLPVIKNTSSDMLDATWPTTKPVTIGNSHTDGIGGTDTPKGTPVPITSCTMLSKSFPSGYYWLLSSNGSRIRVYCDMNKTCGGITGGWMRVTSLDKRQASSKCPSSLCLLQTVPIRSCGRCNGSPILFVSSQTYLAGVSYSHVCGRITAYQLGSPDSYSTLYSNRFDGISITYGSPEIFIWTFLAACHGTACQCADPSNAKINGPPPFIGDHYFCETVQEATNGIAYVFVLNPLWDGAGCRGVSECCSFNNPPWFHRKLQEPTMEPIVMTVRLDEPAHNEDLAIKVIDIHAVDSEYHTKNASSFINSRSKLI